MALVRIVQWYQIDSIQVDKNNPKSKVDKTGTIINPIPISQIRVELRVDGEKKFVTTTTPYNRQKVKDAVSEQVLSKRKQDEGFEFTI